MSVQFYTRRPPVQPYIIEFDEDELDRINSLLELNGVYWRIEPYADTKLTKEQLQWFTSVLKSKNQSALLMKIDALAQYEAVYGYGD